MRKLLLTGVALAVLTGPAHAADLALVLGNADYQRLGDVKGADAPTQSEDALKQAGFAILTESDATAANIRARFRDFVTRAQGADRVVATLSGHFVQSGAETWFLPTDARDRTLPEMVGEALPLSAVLSVLAAHPGQAVLLLGAADDAPDSGQGLTRPGIGDLRIPQGVTVLQGSPSQVADLMSGALVQPGAPLLRAAQRQGLSAQGYLPAQYALLPETTQTTAPAPDPQPSTDPSAPYWDMAQSEDTVAAYQTYIDRFPNGPHAGDAQARINQIKAEPQIRAKAAEDALKLSRDQKREVQQNLTVLNFDPKGVDGIFGPGTRGALSAWQKANGYDQTGYLTSDQLDRLSTQGAKRAAELDAEAKARQAEIDRQDRAYWNETGKAGDEPGLRAYLDKYPDGLYADLAKQRLDKIEADRRTQAQAADRAAWDEARKTDTVVAYRHYLDSRDKPAFEAEAKARILEIQHQNQQSGAMEKAKAREEALNLPPMAKTLVERRLAAMGLDPGKVDGVFDQNTRRAIRRYQKAGGLTTTGYLDQETVAQLLAGAIGLK